MGKNYIPEVAKILGLEIGEEFNILNTDGEVIGSGPYVFTDKAIISWCEEELSSYVLFQLLKGKFTFIKQPWRPYEDIAPRSGVMNPAITCEHYTRQRYRETGVFFHGGK